uniref:Uncharacterized protein n=1 Tax=Eutreptiella gymnastica TaxID=73025 RepID=A0A7S4C7V1_9EUGL
MGLRAKSATQKRPRQLSPAFFFFSGGCVRNAAVGHLEDPNGSALNKMCTYSGVAYFACSSMSEETHEHVPYGTSWWKHFACWGRPALGSSPRKIQQQIWEGMPQRKVVPTVALAPGALLGSGKRA